MKWLRPTDIMGKSDPYLFDFYNRNIPREKPVALLGFTIDNFFGDADLYDLQLNNWNINSDWQLRKQYKTIISTRCPYFAKDPRNFIVKCHEHLEPSGEIFLDWGLGDHWRFADYKIGWIKNGNHEFAYSPQNFLWSCVWSDEFLQHTEYKKFSEKVKKFGYDDVKSAVLREVPSIIELDEIRVLFDVQYELMTLWDDYPQLYIFVRGRKR